MTSTNPMTAIRSDRSISVTPAAAMRAPPTPVRARSGRTRANSAASPDAWRSPDASPAMMSTSRTRDRTRSGLATQPRERRKGALDLADDPQRYRERLAPIAARHHDRLIATNRPDEALELEAERFAWRRFERDAFHERLEREGPLRERSEIDIAAKAIKLPVAGGEVQRDVSALLEDANLSHALARHTARRDVRHRA